MAIALYPHNEETYLAALDMLLETGKAAVIHPTGTGKSFIGFKFCEDFPEKRICWLSPSEYIFRTQLENLAAENSAVPQNITFLTYARIMALDADEIAAIRPDFIILVDDVILFRPTVSPIIYKQQIGRSLSAGSARSPVIFDIVNNIENLCSIGAVEREFEEAVLRSGGSEQERRELR